MRIEKMEPVAPGNPFLSDSVRMGTALGANVMAMFERHTHETQDYIILVDTVTGERIKILFGE